MEKNLQWSSSTKKLYAGILTLAISSIVHYSLGSTFFAFMAGPVTAVFLRWVLPLIIIAGYIIFLAGLSEWPVNVDARNKLRSGSVMAVIALVLMWLPVPFVGWIVKILFLLAFVVLMTGYGSLKKSLPSAGMAQTASVVLLAGACSGIVGMIPGISVVFNPIAVILYITGYIMLIVGWGKIKNARVA